jgi:hypothetical protein
VLPLSSKREKPRWSESLPNGFFTDCVCTGSRINGNQQVPGPYSHVASCKFFLANRVFAEKSLPSGNGFSKRLPKGAEDIAEKIRKFVALWDSPNRIQYQGAPFPARGHGRGEVALGADNQCPFPQPRSNFTMSQNVGGVSLGILPTFAGGGARLRITEADEKIEGYLPKVPKGQRQ